jgi:hypothetical protein
MVYLCSKVEWSCGLNSPMREILSKYIICTINLIPILLLTCSHCEMCIAHSVRIRILSHVHIADKLSSRFVLLFRTFDKSSSKYICHSNSNYNLTRLCWLVFQAEHWRMDYSGDPNTRHPKSGTIWLPDKFMSALLMVRFSYAQDYRIELDKIVPLSWTVISILILNVFLTSPIH